MDRSDHNTRVGLLGGSFNPAHEGHVEISEAALEFLELDYVWWLVSPGNPLKDKSTLAPFEERVETARALKKDDRIIISELERNFETHYTIDTLKKIKETLPRYHYVWLMGADNLAEFDKWKDWRGIAEIVPFAIFSRPSYSKASLDSLAAKALRDYRIGKNKAKALHRMKPPAWVFCDLTDNPASSTEIRSKTM